MHLVRVEQKSYVDRLLNFVKFRVLFISLAILSLALVFSIIQASLMGISLVTLAFALISAASILNRPAAITMVLLASVPALILVPLTIGSISLPLRADDVFYGVVILTGMVALVRAKINPFKGNPLNIPLALFISSYYISMLIGGYNATTGLEIGLLNVLRLLEFVLVYYLAFSFSSVNEIRKYKGIIFYGAVIILCLSLVQHEFGWLTTTLYDYEGGTQSLVGTRFATFQSSHDYAIFLIFALLLMLAHLFNPTKERSEVKFWLLGALLLFGVINGDVRSFLLFFIITVLIGGVWLFHDRKRLLLIVLLAVAILPTLTFSPKIKTLYSILESSNPVIEVLNDPSFMIRTTNWPVVMSEWDRHQLIGNGPGFFPEAAKNKLLDKQTIDNAYLRVLGENGVLGLLLFFIVNSTVVINLFRGAKGNRLDSQPFVTGVLLAVIFFLISAFMSDVFENFKTGLYYWLLIGVTMKLLNRQEAQGQKL